MKIDFALFPGWESLNAFEFNIYPNELVVITNANAEQFKAAEHLFTHYANEGDPKLIEDVLRDSGFFAVTGSQAVWEHDSPFTLDDLLKLFEANLERAKEEADSTADSEEGIASENLTLKVAEAMGWKWEDDEELANYCLKATREEIAAATLEHFKRWLANRNQTDENKTSNG